MNKIEVFEKEINLIQREDIKDFVRKCIDGLPDYFFVIPASSTGKYYPKYALGEGGLVRHTRAAVYIALELMRMNAYKFEQVQDVKDFIIAALLLHDGCKNGVENSGHTLATHPKVVVDYLRQDEEVCSMLSEVERYSIFSLILTHMGQWNTDFKTGEEVLGKPTTSLQQFVHLCDYIASRKCLEFNFDVV